MTSKTRIRFWKSLSWYKEDPIVLLEISILEFYTGDVALLHIGFLHFRFSIGCEYQLTGSNNLE